MAIQSKYQYDLLVIGGGSGGVRASRWATRYGAKVGVCEQDRLGGTCVIRGCVPKKLFWYASHFSEDIAHASKYGWQLKEEGFDWQTFQQRCRQEIGRLENVYGEVLEGAGVELIKGRGQLLGQHEVKVGEQILTADKIIIATGGWPYLPDIPGQELAWSSNQVFEAESQPRSLVVVGGGFIGLEFAGIFHGLGSEVQMVIRQEFVLSRFDRSVHEFIQGEIQKKGIRIHSAVSVEGLSEKGSEIEVQLSDGRVLAAEAVLFATGRKPNTQNLGLQEVGVDTDEKGRIKINDKFQTSVPSIFAIGDCANKLNLTPVALEEAMVVVENLFGGKSQLMSYENIPVAVFSQPPLASVGLREEDCQARGLPHQVYESDFRALKLTLTDSSERSYIKMIVHKDSEKVLGLHMVGADAPEIIQGYAVALRAGLTKKDFDHTLGIHPTSSEEIVTLR